MSQRSPWGPSTLDVEQSFGDGQSRAVHIELDGGLPVSLAYGGKTWTYDYPIAGQLAEVVLPGQSPGGQTWRYEYATGQFDAGKVSQVTTPQGGVVQYSYGDHWFYDPSGTPRVVNALATRQTDDQNGRSGNWTFAHLTQSSEAVDQTEVTLPSGTRVMFEYGAASGPNILAGTWVLRSRIVQAPDDTIVEQEQRHFTAPLRAARTEEAWGVPQLARRTITRAGQTYTNEYDYGALGTHFHNYHHPTTITERSPAGTVERATQLTYDHPLTPYRLVLPKTESVTIQGMTATKSWNYNTTTGFRTSETLYGIRTNFTPDALGNVGTATKANGKSTSYTYSWGVLKDTITPEVTITRTINPDGTVASETVAGRTTAYEYDDPLGRLTKTQPPGTVNPIEVDYDDASRTVTTVRGDSWTRTTTDGFGRPIETLNSVGVKTRTRYDAEGRKQYQSYPFISAEVGTELVYDSLWRLTEEINPDGTRQTRSYDDATNWVTVRDEENRATVLGYRGFGHPDDARLVSVVDANGQEWSYSYDAIGNLARVVTPTGHTRTWLRNASGLLTSETHPESGTTWYTDYDSAGVLKRKVDAKGTPFTYQHDANDRVIRITAGTQVTAITYESGSDNRWSTSNGSASTVFVYDASTGRVQQRHDVADSYVFITQYQYDGNDRVVEITYPLGRKIRYDYNTEGQITRVFEPVAGRDYAAGMTYHASGAVAGYTASNAISTATAYDPYRYWVRSVTAGPLQLTYGDYDAVGNVGTIGDSRGSTWSQAFTYDPLHRLWTAIGPYGRTDYAYDAHGNRQTTSSSSYAYDPDTLRLIAQNGQPLTYDANGNLTGTSAATFTYTFENRLNTATGSDGTTTYAYNADGWRAKKTAPGDTTVYVRGLNHELLMEWHNLGATARARDYVYAGSRLLAAVDRPTVPFPGSCGGESSPDGSPVALTIAPGAVGQFTFEGSACRRVSAVINTSNVGSCGGGWFRMLKPDGTALVSISNICTSQIIGPSVLPVSGTYTVIVDPAGSTSGQVTASAYDVVDVTGFVTFGASVNTPLTTPGQRGVWTFTGTANQRVSAVVNTSTVGSCGAGLFSILKPDGTTLVSVSNICTGQIIGPSVLPVSGTYAVVVDPAGSTTGQVTMTVYDITDVTGPVVFGHAASASLSTPGQRGVWTFTGTPNQRVSAVINTSTVGSCGAGLFSILKPDGTTLASISNICTGQVIGPSVLPVGGTYRVVVDPAGATTGVVTMTLYDIVDATGPAPFGQAVSATLGTPGQRGLWTFTGTANQRVSAVVNTSTVGNCGAGLFSIVKPDGTTLVSVSNICTGQIIGPSTLPVSGSYAVIVDPAGATTGQVTMTVYDVIDVTGPIAVNGSAATGGLTTPGQRGLWTFQATAGQAVRAVIDASTVGACGAGLFSILKPDGATQVSSGNVCTGKTIGPSTVPGNGAYTVVVDPGGATTGSVTVRALSP